MPKSRQPAREQVLSAASEAFYAEGIHAIGVDTVVERSGVAKMTLYRHFPSKEDLVVAYLHASDEAFWAWFDSTLEGVTEPREQLLRVYRATAALAARPECRGCAFNMSAGEFPDHDHPVHQAALTNKRKLRERLRAMSEAAGARDPDALADQLFLLMDGAWSAKRMFGPHSPAGQVGDAARVLIDAQIPV